MRYCVRARTRHHHDDRLGCAATPVVFMDDELRRVVEKDVLVVIPVEKPANVAQAAHRDHSADLIRMLEAKTQRMERAKAGAGDDGKW